MYERSKKKPVAFFSFVCFYLAASCAYVFCCCKRVGTNNGGRGRERESERRAGTNVYVVWWFVREGTFNKMCIVWLNKFIVCVAFSVYIFFRTCCAPVELNLPIGSNLFQIVFQLEPLHFWSMIVGLFHNRSYTKLWTGVFVCVNLSFRFTCGTQYMARPFPFSDILSIAIILHSLSNRTLQNI